MNNRLHNLTNPHQGKEKRVLALCSAGLLRSPTVAWVLSNDPWNYNTRAAGVNLEYALIPVDVGLITWADEIICVEKAVENQLKWFAEDNKINLTSAHIVTLAIPDHYKRRSSKLVEIIKAQYTEYQHATTNLHA